MSCPRQRLVDAHFDSGQSLAAEREMRAHLPSCASCQSRYDRRLLLDRLDPAAPTAEMRLARGLGLVRPASRHRLVASIALATAAAAACALLVFPLVRSDGFSARGQGSSVVVAYRMDGERSLVLGTDMKPRDELAFAYDNAEGYSYLMVFAIDENRHLYWYYPAWIDPQLDPEAVAIDKENGLVELSEAIRHELPPGALRLVALFLDSPVSVRQVEGMVEAQGLESLGQAWPRAKLVIRPIHVEVTQ